MLSDPEQISNLFTPRGLACSQVPLVINGRLRQRQRRRKKRENKESGEKRVGVKEDGVERRHRSRVVES